MIWKLAHDRVLDLTDQPALMGILNVTPDSFSDGGRYTAVEAAVDHARAMFCQGAQIVDIGGQSTRPHAPDITSLEEQRRVLPIIEALSNAAVGLISIDTFHASTARLAVNAGAHIINDVTGLQGDSEMANVAAQTGAGLCIMHNSRNRTCLPDMIDDQKDFFAQSLKLAQQAGIEASKIVLDVGFGFGIERAEDNIELMTRLDALHELGYPLMVGTSRKRFLGSITGRDVHERDVATAVTTALLHQKGVHIFRVHNVAYSKDALKISTALLKARQDHVHDNS